MKFVQICGLVPPSRDGVGDAAVKIQSIFRHHGCKTVIITSADQQMADDIHCDIPRWTSTLFRVLTRKCVELGVRVVLLHYPSPRFGRSLSLTILPLLLRIKDLRTILYLHEYESYSFLGRLRIALMMKCSALTITVDSRNFTLLQAAHSAPKDVYLLPTGANIRPGTRLTSDVDVSPVKAANDKFHICYFGFVRAGKGLMAVIDALQSNPDIQEKIVLDVVGGLMEIPEQSDHDLLDRLKSLPCVTFHDYVSEERARNIIENADGMILPFDGGLTERRGSFMTAMAFGKALITSRPLTPIDGLIDRSNIVLLESNRASEVADAIRSLCQLGHAELNALAAGAKEWYNSRHSDEEFFSHLSDLLRLVDNAE